MGSQCPCQSPQGPIGPGGKSLLGAEQKEVEAAQLGQGKVEEEGLTAPTHAVQLRANQRHNAHVLSSSNESMFSFQKPGLAAAASVLKHNIIWHPGRGRYTRKTFSLIFLPACEGKKNQ